MALLSLPRPSGRFHDLPLAIKSIAGFWIFYFLTILVRSTLVGTGLPELISVRTLAIGVGIALTFLVYIALKVFAARGSLRRMVIVAALACIPAAFAFATFNYAVAFLQEPLRDTATERTPDGTVLTQSRAGELRIQRRNAEVLVVQVKSANEIMRQIAPRYIADSAVTWYFFFAAWASFYVAMSSANQLRLAERRASLFEREAQSAQLRALRYQVNPHFLFNTLNSLSSLIMGKRGDEAETMILNLSDFFRSTLSIDPTEDVTLEREIALQMLYLDIEKTRFPRRLKVDIAIADDLRDARIPALLLQPIVENAIKYGVARSRRTVILSIRASGEAGVLTLIVENDGDGSVHSPDPAAASTGVGLGNVCARLAARFGSEASCVFGPRAEGGFRVTLTMPVVKNG